MRSANISNKNLLVRNLVFAVMLLFSLVAGCKHSPFSPDAKMIVSTVSQSVLAPTPSDDSSKYTSVLPPVTVTMKLLQGTGVFIDYFSVDYLCSNEVRVDQFYAAELAPGDTYRSSGKISAYLTSDSDVTLSIPAYSRKLYERIHIADTAEIGLLSDNSPVIAVMTIYGTDANSNRVSATGYTTLTTVPADMVSGS